MSFHPKYCCICPVSEFFPSFFFFYRNHLDIKFIRLLKEPTFGFVDAVFCFILFWSDSSPTLQVQIQSYSLSSFLSPLVLFSYWILCGSIFSLPVVRYSCPLLADVIIRYFCYQIICSFPNCEITVLHSFPTVLIGKKSLCLAHI